MLDFTSALYLGFRHPSAALPAWTSLTLGRPSALRPAPGEERLAGAVAALLGTERAAFATSVLHALIDLGAFLPRTEAAVVLDRSTYPIAHWGGQRAAGRGTTVRSYASAPSALADTLRACREGALVITDGLRPGSGTVPPLAELAHVARAHDSVLLVDDTQVVGLLGTRADAAHPYGFGGGGSLRFHQLELEPAVIVVASLAKAFGVPVCVVGGSAPRVERWLAESETRVHTSPPSAATYSALALALALNERSGDARRARLLTVVQRFRAGLQRGGVDPDGGSFPVQALPERPVASALTLHARLRRAGIVGLVQRSPDGRYARVCFVLSAAQHPPDVERAAVLIGKLAREQSARGAA